MESKNDNFVNISEYVILDSSSVNGLNSSRSTSNNSPKADSMLKDITVFSCFDAFIEDPIFSPIVQKIQDQKNSVSERVKKKTTDLLNCIIGKNTIDFKKLRKFMFEGLPDEYPSLRSLLWKLMFNHLPNSVKEWKDYLTERRLDYENIKMDFIGENTLDEKNSFLLGEIIKDVKRTRTHMHFFTSTCNNKEKETNADVITRILYIFAKLHPDVSYVQGMNELIAIVYYCFSADTNPFFESSIEADVFYCFENLMLEIKEIFLREKDDTDSGIHYRIKKISYLLEFNDKELYDHLKKEKVELEYFMFRWFTLLFTQEFYMPEILRLWDAIVIQNDKFEFLSYLCLAVIIQYKRAIIHKDFSNIMYVMQNLNLLEIDIETLIKRAVEIKSKLSNLLISF